MGVREKSATPATRLPPLSDKEAKSVRQGLKSIIIALFLACTGCAHYGYVHRAFEFALLPDRTNIVQEVHGTNVPVSVTNVTWRVDTNHVRYTVDRTGVTTFFMLGNGANLKSDTVDGSYSKTVNIGSLQGSVDANAIEKAFEGAGNAAGVAFRAAAGFPPLPTAIPAIATPAALPRPLQLQMLPLVK